MATDCSGMSEYELQRMKNMEENRRILESIRQEQLVSFEALYSSASKKTEKKVQPRKKRRLASESGDVQGNEGPIRKSARLSGKNSTFSCEGGSSGDDTNYDSQAEECSDEDDDDEGSNGDRKRKRPGHRSSGPRPRVPVPKNRPNAYGAIPGVEVGRIWETRMECTADGVHRPPVAGIHAGPEGAYSIALSGGYEDDVDWGHCFTYTGEGGRALNGTKAKPKNLRTAPQSRDQTLTRGNLAMSLNVASRRPVRVIRGYKVNNAFAPEYGYRYDGLYTVEKYWSCTGKSGFKVFKFALRRCSDQEPAPWLSGSSVPPAVKSGEHQSDDDDEDKENEKPAILQVKLFSKK